MPMTQTLRRAAVVVALAAAAVTQYAIAGGDWNDAQIQWRGYDEGLADAKSTKKPICLIFYTDWCPHCQNYSKVFHDPKVVEKSKDFVMIRLNGDQNKDISAKYALDGAYIPRTFFLSPAGVVETGITARPDKFKYFYDEKNPASVLAGMDAALQKMK